MDIKPMSIKWEVSNFSPGRSFDKGRCIKDRLGGFLSKDINRRSIVSSRTGSTYKYTRTEGSKICNNYILQIPKRSSSSCANGQSRNIRLFGKNGRDKKPSNGSADKGNIGILFSQSDHTYCRIPARDLKYQGKQGFKGNNNFSREWILSRPMFQKRIQGLGTVDVDLFACRLCHQIPRYIKWQPDPHAWMVDTFQISSTHLKAYVFAPFTLIGRVLAKAMRDKFTLIIVTPVRRSQPWNTTLLRVSIQDSIFIAPFPDIFTDPN